MSLCNSKNRLNFFKDHIDKHFKERYRWLDVHPAHSWVL